jgi:hypothetical protein
MRRCCFFILAVGSLMAAEPNRIYSTRIGPVKSSLFISKADGSEEQPLLPATGLDHNPRMVKILEQPENQKSAMMDSSHGDVAIWQKIQIRVEFGFERCENGSSWRLVHSPRLAWWPLALLVSDGGLADC